MSDPSAAPASVPESGGPDWDRVKEEIACPLCDYNLRGLIEPRCPECGYRFEWEEMLDPTRRSHPYLFEHHPERNGWSFWRTQWGGLFPGRFWRTLHPAQPSRPRRVVVYWLCNCLLFIGVWAAIFVHEAVDRYQAVQANRAAMASRLSVEQLDRVYPLPPHPRFFMNVLNYSSYGPVLAVFTGYLVWPWLTVGALMVYWQSMHRSRVKAVHVLRSVMYSFDLSVSLLVAVLLWAMFMDFPEGLWWQPRRMWGGQGWSTGHLYNTMLMLGVPVMVLAMWRIGTAYRVYLRFAQPYGAILLAQIIVFLALLAGHAAWML